MRRTMVAARYFLEILNPPHRHVAANFKGSPRGDAPVVDYFFNGNPSDQALMRTQKSAYAVTRDIIAYSYEDTDRLEQDVTRWASNWQDSLEAAARVHPISFAHGAENTMFDVAAIEAFVTKHAASHLHKVSGEGQLAVFQNPAILVRSLLSLATRTKLYPALFLKAVFFLT